MLEETSCTSCTPGPCFLQPHGTVLGQAVLTGRGLHGLWVQGLAAHFHPAVLPVALLPRTGQPAWGLGAFQVPLRAAHIQGQR